MTRKSTIVWIVSAIVVVGAGVGVAAASLPRSSHVAGTPTTSSSPSASTTEAGSSPSASATSPAVIAPSDPATTSASPSASASPKPSATTKPTVTLKSVTPALTFYQWTAGTSTLEVGGNVPGLVDAGGSCIVTATMGAITVTQSFPASPQASSTECGTMKVVSSKLTTGTWNLSIGYRSPRAAGTSASTAVTL